MPARDYSALTAPVTKSEVAEFRRGVAARARSRSASTVVSIVVVAVVGLIFLIVGGSILSVFASIADDSGSRGPWSGVVVAVIVVVVVIGAILLGIRSSAVRWARRLRQSRFADANGLGFSSGDTGPRYPGAIFDIGSSRRTGDHFFRSGAPELDFGNYYYTTGSGKNRTRHQWGFLALRLSRNLPHMVLDARDNNGLFGGTNLPAVFQRDQVLSLEGDFDRYFTLYCPKRYERDALYMFTPDLMALLIDNASAFDVEIVDQWLFVYSSNPFAMDDPATIETLLRIVDTVGAKTLSRIERYSDDRAQSRSDAGFTPGAPAQAADAGGIVAPEGRRLRRRLPITGAVLVGGILLYWILVFVVQR